MLSGLTCRKRYKIKRLKITPIKNHLFLVPLDMWQKDEADLRVGVFIHDVFTFCLFLQDVVDPLWRQQVKRKNVSLSYIHSRGKSVTHLNHEVLIDVRQRDALIVSLRLLH